MEPRPKLQATLSHNWMFNCMCSRCSDPSEMGLYFSSQKVEIVETAEIGKISLYFDSVAMGDILQGEHWRWSNVMCVRMWWNMRN